MEFENSLNELLNLNSKYEAVVEHLNSSNYVPIDNQMLDHYMSLFGKDYDRYLNGTIRCSLLEKEVLNSVISEALRLKEIMHALLLFENE